MNSEAPLYPVAALGFRVWNSVDDELKPIAFTPTSWGPGEIEAICFGGEDHPEGAPTPSPEGAFCRCGLHAYHDLADAALHIFTNAQVPNPVIGAVAGYGRLEVHVNGWRA